MKEDPELPMDFAEANQRCIVAELALLKSWLVSDAAAEQSARSALEQALDAMPEPPILDRLAQTFGLSPFERALLLLCAGIELDASIATSIASRRGDPRLRYATFGLALAVLPDAHWSALGPDAPLRKWSLLELDAESSLTQSPLRIDERILHHIVGVDQPDPRLLGLLWRASSEEPSLFPSQEATADQISATLRPGRATRLLLLSDDPEARRHIATSASASFGLPLDILDAISLLSHPNADALGLRVAREMLIGGSTLLVEADELDANDALRVAQLRRLVNRLPGTVFVGARERLPFGPGHLQVIETARPTVDERRALFRAAIVEREGEEGQFDTRAALIDRLAHEMDLSDSALQGAIEEARRSSGDLGNALWDACRAAARGELAGLTDRLVPSATWEDLVVPEPTERALQQIVASVRYRSQVFDDWGFSDKSARGLGTGVLFAGPSGTGKTMAAEVIANELGLDLHRIDLSRLVSKFVGETEKNLRRLFDAAERGAAILLFDEADALFGRRGEVREGMDRYANLEVAYLLQRMESYRGLCLLTTNLERNIDPAFSRRLRFILRFSLPSLAEREAIWRRIFPKQTPTEGLDFTELAKMSLSGGSIRNAAIRAAFLAAEAGKAVGMDEVRRGVGMEEGRDLPRTTHSSVVSAFAPIDP